MEELVDILCRPELRQMVADLCEEAEEMHLNWRPGKKGIGPAWSPAELAPDLAQRLGQVHDALLDAREREEIEGYEKRWWWEYEGDYDCREHWGRYVAQEVRKRLGLPLQGVFDDPRQPWDRPQADCETGLSVEDVQSRDIRGPAARDVAKSEQDEPCLHPRLSLEVYTGVIGSADDRGDWMCTQCGETFTSRAAAEKDRQRLRASLAKTDGTQERNEGVC